MAIVMSVQGAISQGVLWGLMTLGVYITFKILNFADMSVDGSFALGGAVSAILIVKGMNPWLSLIPAVLMGMLAGGVTGVLHTKIKIPEILAGILTMIALYSINIRIMGQANTSLLGEDTVITSLSGISRASTNTLALVIGIIVSVLVIVILYWFFGTEVGSALRATGNNEYMVRALGANTDTMKIIGLMLGNGLVALSGAFVAQSQGYADVGMGQGTIVIGLASIIIGEVVFGNRFNFAYKLAAVVGGSIIYRIIIAVVLQLGMKSTDLKLLTAVIVAFALAMPVVSKKVKGILSILFVVFMFLMTRGV
ncbi:MAG: ABC transporter permease [Cellulosilyticum sp.]|nr:ABC transporter permease [Cellulosilyticum sp.]